MCTKLINCLILADVAFSANAIIHKWPKLLNRRFPNQTLKNSIRRRDAARFEGKSPSYFKAYI